MIKKSCNKCESEYLGTNRSKYCNNCVSILKKESQKRYRENNKEKRSKSIKEWRSLNKDHILEYKRDYRKNNPEKIKNQRDRHYSKSENKKKKYYQDKAYRDNNKLKIRKRQSEWVKSNPHQLMRSKISHRIRESLKSKGLSKNGSIFKYLDYTPIELKEHLESKFEPWMNWNNYGVYRLELWDDNDQSTWTWQIDHIIPHSSFDYRSMDDSSFKECWSLNNLRPFSSKKNLLKGDKIEQ